MSENQQPLDEEQAASAAEKELASAQAMPAEPDSSPSADSDTLADGLAADEGNSEIPAEEDADISDDESEYEEDISDDEEEEEEDIDPADVRILGMPRVCFHLAAFGGAVGYIACGLGGLLALVAAILLVHLVLDGVGQVLLPHPVVGVVVGV